MIALRGGYGSVQILPHLDASSIPGTPPAFVGYSDVTSIHIYLACVAGVASIHGPMIDGRLAHGDRAYDPTSFLGCLRAAPLGELAPEGVHVLIAGDVTGPLLGGTLTQIVGSLGTPYAFQPPAGYVLFIDEVGERPYRLDRMMTQMRLSGLLAKASAVVFGQLPHCDDADASITAEGVVADALRGFHGPVLFGFPSGHSTSAMISLPLGVATRVVASGAPRLVIEESAVAE
jgi:muramoyltetrapeptide carboxypeptidase